VLFDSVKRSFTHVASDPQYAVKGNLVKVTRPTVNGQTPEIHFSYDASGHLTEVTYANGNTVQFAYDKASNLIRRTPAGNAVTQRAEYQLDLANQLLGVTNSIVGGGTISGYGYTYDNVGNRLSMTAPSGAHNYTYNPIYELTNVSGAQTHSFVYDKVANRVTADGVGYTANTVNQYTQVGGVVPTYDANGNLTWDSDRTYTYDEENRLTSAQRVPHTASYTYDGFNRRVSKTVDGVATYYVYDGDEVAAEYNSSGVVQAEYVLGPDIDEPIVMDRGGQRYYYHYDGLGSVSEVTDAWGNVAESYTYDVYGTPSVTSSLIGVNGRLKMYQKWA